jgi:hypothetical protein
MIKKIPQDTECFRYYNANPKDRRTTDCVIRAISTSTGKSWDDVLDGLIEIAHKYKIMVDDTPCYDRYLVSLGYSKMKQPRKDDNTKYTGAEFCEYLKKFRKGKYDVVAHIGGHHIVAIVDSKVVDTWDSTGGTIGNYWIRKR